MGLTLIAYKHPLYRSRVRRGFKRGVGVKHVKHESGARALCLKKSKTEGEKKKDQNIMNG